MEREGERIRQKCGAMRPRLAALPRLTPMLRCQRSDLEPSVASLILRDPLLDLLARAVTRRRQRSGLPVQSRSQESRSSCCCSGGSASAAYSISACVLVPAGFRARADASTGQDRGEQLRARAPLTERVSKAAPRRTRKEFAFHRDSHAIEGDGELAGEDVLIEHCRSTVRPKNSHHYPVFGPGPQPHVIYQF